MGDDSPSPAWRAALTARKLRLGPLPPGLEEGVLLDAVWPLLRARRPAPGISQDELVEVLGLEGQPPERTVRVRWSWDQDFCSMYDAVVVEELVVRA